MNVHLGRLTERMHGFKPYNLILNIWSPSASAELDTAANITERGFFFFFFFLTLRSNVVYKYSERVLYNLISTPKLIKDHLIDSAENTMHDFASLLSFSQDWSAGLVLLFRLSLIWDSPWSFLISAVWLAHPPRPQAEAGDARCAGIPA